MGEWKEYRLSDIINIIGGGTPSRSKPEFWSGTIPWLSVKDFNNDRRYVESTEEHISLLGLNKSSTKILTDGQIIISARGTVGELAQVVGEMAFNQSCYGLDAKSEYLTNDYLYYLMKYTVINLKKLTHGAVFDTITKNTFDYANINIPEIKKQSEIVKILGSLDDKIELDRKMNETLEEMARAIFKSWFVDFDPVHAKARGEKPAGIPDEIADLFPSEFVHSDQLNKPIPKGWEVKPINCLADLNSKSWTNKNAPQKIKYIDLANTKNGEIGLVIEYLFSEAPSRARRVLSIGDTIIGTVRPGNRSFAYISDDGLTGSTGFAVMTPKQFAFKEFVFLALTEDSSIDYFAHLADGAAYPAIRPEVVANIEFVIPPENIVKAFSVTTADLLVKIGLNRKQNIELSVIRDSLLPKLISGEIEV